MSRYSEYTRTPTERENQLRNQEQATRAANTRIKNNAFELKRKIRIMEATLRYLSNNAPTEWATIAERALTDDA